MGIMEKGQKDEEVEAAVDLTLQCTSFSENVRSNVRSVCGKTKKRMTSPKGKSYINLMAAGRSHHSESNQGHSDF